MLRSVTRTLAFYVKWLAEVVRQPALMLSLVVGPFLLLAAFGQGAKLGVPKPKTYLVVPQTAPSGPLDPVPEDLDRYLNIVGKGTDLAVAREQLRQGKAELVAVLPTDPLSTVKSGQHVSVQILTNEIDPVRKTYTRTFLSQQVSIVNQQAIEKAITEAQGSIDQIQALTAQGHQSVKLARAANSNSSQRQQVSALKNLLGPLSSDSGKAGIAATGAAFVIPGLGVSAANDPAKLSQSVDSLNRQINSLDARLTSDSSATASPQELDQIDQNLTAIDNTTALIKSIPAEVLSAPFQADVENIAPFVPTLTGFYGPAVLALLVQHLAITLGALSMARIRLLGLMELLKASPVRPTEVTTGNYLSYGSLCALAAAVLTALLVYVLGVPVAGSYVPLVATLALLILSSLGIGFFISMVSSSELQAAQIAMLMLIATVFFSGFLVSLDTIVWPVRAISYIIPATYAIRTLQDVMLRGLLRTPTDLWVLGGVSIAFFFLTVALFRREYRPR